VLLVAGDGPTRVAVEAQAARTCPEGSIRFLGARQDADALLAAADVVVLSTDWEGMPISLLEAMSAGVPVVATAVGGIVETLGPAARLVEPGSTASLATALTELLTDPEARRARGVRGRDLVATRFPVDRMVDGHDAVIREALGTIREEVRP
jgi:glycosyltransferase involved in cell wall biosynthesis